MLGVSELITHLQLKIQDYRASQKRSLSLLSPLEELRLLLGTSLQQSLRVSLKKLYQQCETTVRSIAGYYQTQLSRQRNAYEQEISELSGNINRQYKVIDYLNKELDDVMVLLKKQQSRQQGDKDKDGGEEGKGDSREENGDQRSSDMHTINGLEIIEQEETERTLRSSMHSHSCLEECRSPSRQDHFIRIEQKDHPLIPSLFQRTTNPPSPSIPSQTSHSPSNPSPQISAMLEPSSNYSETFNQYDSLPLEAGNYITNQFCREQQDSGLRDVTNQGEQERQSKSKMFLEEFGKTFLKCLSGSSVGVGRKMSSKSVGGSKNGTARHATTPQPTTRIDIKPLGTDPSENSRLITQMLQNIDNNNKFSVGTRKSELRYQGQRKEGTRNGQGILYYSNGLSYEGEFKSGLRHGFGILRFNQIEIYRGQWAADELCGQGKLKNCAIINKRKNQTGSPLFKWITYHGFFRDNRFQGEGTLHLQGGEKFLGKFICGLACGEGVRYRKNGEVETGIWRNGQLVEKC